MNLQKRVLEKLVKSLHVNLFWAGFSHLEPMCSTALLLLSLHTDRYGPVQCSVVQLPVVPPY